MERFNHGVRNAGNWLLLLDSQSFISKNHFIDCQNINMFLVRIQLPKLKKGGVLMKDRKRLIKLLIGISIGCLMFALVAAAPAADITIGGGAGLAPD